MVIMIQLSKGHVPVCQTYFGKERKIQQQRNNKGAILPYLVHHNNRCCITIKKNEEMSPLEQPLSLYTHQGEPF